MISPRLFIILGAVALLVGMAALAFVRKIPERGWVGLTLLLISSGAWSLIEAGEKSNPLMMVVFMLTAPTATVYSFRARRLATDRVAAKAAFVGSFILGALLLFTIMGTAYALFLIVLMEFQC